jgi:hypothetical protein
MQDEIGQTMFYGAFKGSVGQQRRKGIRD